MLNFAARHIATVAVGLFAVTSIAHAATPTVGQAAPAFKLKDQDGKVHDLADYKGKWVALYFYPKDDTPGCTTQACGFRDQYADITAAGAVVLGISPDAPAVLARWRAKQHFPYDLLSDPDHAVLARYGAWGEKKMYGRAFEGVIRSHFVIDGTGKLVDQHLKISPRDSVERAVAFLQGRE